MSYGIAGFVWFVAHPLVASTPARGAVIPWFQATYLHWLYRCTLHCLFEKRREILKKKSKIQSSLLRAKNLLNKRLYLYMNKCLVYCFSVHGKVTNAGHY